MYKANLFNSLKAIYDKKRISAISKSNWGNYSLRTNKIFQTLLNININTNVTFTSAVLCVTTKTKDCN